MTDTEEFPIPVIPDDIRAVVMDALIDARPHSIEHADRMLAAVGLGPVPTTPPVIIARGVPVHIGDMLDDVFGDIWDRPLPQNMALHEQPGHPRRASLILAELDSPEGRGAIANEERRRRRAMDRTPFRSGASAVYVNPPYEASALTPPRHGKPHASDALERGYAIHREAERATVSIGGSIAAARLADREWRKIAALVTTTYNTPSMLAAARLAFLPRELVELADEMLRRENRALLETINRKDSK